MGPATAPEEEPPATTEGGGEEKASEEESTATFTPVVKLDEVDVKTGEEEEEVLFAVRSKLFVFGETLLDQGTGVKTWKERGIREARLLKHKEHGKIRLLMRQEKTMKVIVNHVIDPRIRLEPNAGSDRSWVWSAFDFSDGELVETVFAMRFSDSKVAGTFKEKFAECQKNMEVILAGEDEVDQAAGDEAADALESLTTKEESADA